MSETPRREDLTVKSLVPMAFAKSVPRSNAFYGKLGFVEGNTHTVEGAAEPTWAWLTSGNAHLMLARASEPVEAGPVTRPFYAPRGEFRVIDPDGYVLMVSHT